MLRQTIRKTLATTMAALCIFTSCPTLALAKTSLEVANEHGAELSEHYQPKGSIVTEDHTGRILWAEDIDTQWTPASMSKLMVILLAYDAIDQGKLTLNTEAPVTDEIVKLCQNYELANNNMQKGASYTVGELIDLIIVPSSAAGTYMLADLVNPDRAELVKMMNDRAQSLQMTDTHYANPIGVRNEQLGFIAPANSDPKADNISSVRDYAILTGELINKYPDILNHTKNFRITVKEGTPYEEVFKGYVHSLPGARYEYEGTEGIKSGSADKGYNYTTTCKRGDTRLNLVIMGVGWWELEDAEWKRHLIGNALYDEAYDAYEYRQILAKGETYTVGDRTFTAKEDLYDCVHKGFTFDNLVIDTENNTARTDTQTDFLPGYQAPTAKIAIHSFLFGAPGDMDPMEAAKTFLIAITATVGLIFILKRTFTRKKTGYQSKADARRRTAPRKKSAPRNSRNRKASPTPRTDRQRSGKPSRSRQSTQTGRHLRSQAHRDR